MPPQRHRAFRPIAFLLLAAAALLAQAPAPAALKPAVPYSAYDGWRAINGTVLSHDGQWLAYALVPEDGDGELVVRNLSTGVEHRTPRGEKPQITADGRYVVFTLVPTRAARDAAKHKTGGKSGPAPKNGLGIMDLATGAVQTVANVKSFELAENASAYVAYRLDAAKEKGKAESAESAGGARFPKPDEFGSELVIRNLASGTIVTVADVADYVWSKDGAHLALAVHSKDHPDLDGAFLWTAADGVTAKPQALLTGPGVYKQLAWNETGSQLAFVSDQKDASAAAPVFSLYRAAAGAAATAVDDSALPAGMAVSEWGKLSFSRDGHRLYFGIAPRPRPRPKTADDPVQVDIWSWTDAELQPTQAIRAEEEAEQSYRAAVDLTAAQPRMVALASAAIPELMLTPDGAHAVLASDVPYKLAESWQSARRDYYAVNLADGSRRKLLTAQPFRAQLSPGGQYLLYFDAHNYSWHSLRLRDGQDTNLTAALGVAFQDVDADRPEPQDAYGVAGWTANDAAVLVYDQYDIWALAPGGGNARNLTQGLGRREHLTFRYEKLDPKADVIPADQPLLLSAVNDDTQATGFYRLASLDATAAPAPLIMRDARLGRVLKARDAATVVFTQERFDQFPNLWAANTRFASPRQISDANPQQANYRWGKAELINYINRDGKKLRAVLIKPDGFDPHKQYPLMVYIYERLTDTMHHYIAPAPGHSINLTRFVSHGYVVLEPDIVYDTGDPGDSALKCVLPAIETVQAMGFVDPHRIGIQGHSWGGYEVAYMITRTDKFRAVEAGAVVADMISAYGGIRWGTGISRESQYEHGQSRIGGSLWQDPLDYIQNSPLFRADRVHTPYLTIHNDADDAVPWYQGIEFYLALRRLHKPAWMFSFHGEKHHLLQRENQKYYTVHMDEFFDHYLLNAPEPQWMKTGVPYLQRGERDVDALFEPKGGTRP
ncbi:MAG TPA: prolyl oligopeptidase family serine peptidase [Terriglobales bacterium]|nr:prolyl oligopeptidase family serine peptidase [Terriglobales bacterium]